jgi:hypothetical protein
MHSRQPRERDCMARTLARPFHFLAGETPKNRQRAAVRAGSFPERKFQQISNAKRACILVLTGLATFRVAIRRNYPERDSRTDERWLSKG